MTEISPQQVESRARYLYLADTSNTTVHCNRFPSWSEISEASRTAYLDRARKALTDEQ